MKLITAEIERKLLASPLHSHDGEEPENVPIIVKLFTPWSCWTWFVTEAEKLPNGDWLFFGMVHGLERELGYFNLSELQAIKGPFGLKVERDLHYTGHKLSEVL